MAVFGTFAHPLFILPFCWAQATALNVSHPVDKALINCLPATRESERGRGRRFRDGRVRGYQDDNCPCKLWQVLPEKGDTSLAESLCASNSVYIQSQSVSIPVFVYIAVYVYAYSKSRVCIFFFFRLCTHSITLRLCYTAQYCLPSWHPSLTVPSLQEVRCVTSHQPACIWDKWGINTYWLVEMPQETLPFSLPASPQRPGIEGRWSCVPNGAQHTGHV